MEMGNRGLLVFPCGLERSGYGQRVGFSDAKVGGEDAHSRHSPKAAPAPPASCRRERKQSGARKTNLRNATIPGNLITGPARTAIGRQRERPPRSGEGFQGYRTFPNHYQSATWQKRRGFRFSNDLCKDVVGEPEEKAGQNSTFYDPHTHG